MSIVPYMIYQHKSTANLDVRLDLYNSVGSDIFRSRPVPLLHRSLRDYKIQAN